MRAVISRVSSASVVVDGQTVGQIEKGFLIFLGVSREDTPDDAVWLADRVCKLRVFEDEAGKMNVSPLDAGASLLVVPNFTLCGDCVSSRRPSFIRAAPPSQAETLYEQFLSHCRTHGLPLQTGLFGADMKVHSVADGPVTLIIMRSEE